MTDLDVTLVAGCNVPDLSNLSTSDSSDYKQK